MYCSSCGAEIEGQAKFCPECGNPIAQAAPVRGGGLQPESDETKSVVDDSGQEASGESGGSGPGGGGAGLAAGGTVGGGGGAVAGGGGTGGSVLGFVADTDMKTLDTALQIAAAAIGLGALLAMAMSNWLGFIIGLAVAAGIWEVKTSIDKGNYARAKQLSPWLGGVCIFFGMVAMQGAGGGVLGLIEIGSGAVMIWAFLRVKDLA